MIRIVTDSAADITYEEAKRLNIEIAPLKISFKDEVYIQDIDLSFDEFYEKLKNADELPFTSQPSPNDFLNIFNEAKQCKDSVVYIGISSKLSGTLQSAHIAKETCEYSNIYLIDSLQAVVGLRILVEYAVKLRDEGKTASEIYEIISEARTRVDLWAMVDTLKYLYKGGRLSKGAAALGSMIQIKPIITLKDGAIEVIDKARGLNGGIKSILNFIDSSTGIDPVMPVYYGYTYVGENCNKLKVKADEKYGLTGTKSYAVGGVIGTHVGPGAIVVGYIRKK